MTCRIVRALSLSFCAIFFIVITPAYADLNNSYWRITIERFDCIRNHIDDYLSSSNAPLIVIDVINCPRSIGVNEMRQILTERIEPRADNNLLPQILNEGTAADSVSAFDSTHQVIYFLRNQLRCLLSVNPVLLEDNIVSIPHYPVCDE